jgi:hypothetical protein
VNGPATATRSERELVGVVARFLEARGYRVRCDPDGTDYFDIVARRGDEIGLVEVKVRDARTVLAQAVRRRGWGAWTAVALGAARAARHLADRTAATRAAPVGVWIVNGESVEVVREARPWVAPGADDPFVDLRDQFRRWLDLIESLGPDTPVVWDGIPGAVRRASGGRSFSEWRLDETAERRT